MLLAMAVAFGQQPAPAPVFPTINPAQAKLDGTLTGLDGPGFAIAGDEDSGYLAAACEHGSIACWPKDVCMGVRAGGGTECLLAGHQGPVPALACRGNVLASAGSDQEILLWDVAECKIRHTVNSGAAIRALAMTPDGKLLASSGDDTAVQLWDTATGKPASKLSAHTDWVLALAFSGDGKLLASGGYDGTIRLWEPTSGKKVIEFAAKPPPPANTPAGPTNVVQALAFSPDNKFLAVGGSDTQVHLFSVPDGKFVRSMPGHASSVTGVQFHPSGTMLASCSKDRTVKLWNPANAQMLKSLEGHTAWVQGIVFLAKGTRLASVGADETVRLWDLAEVKK
jgi:WD40 repeat protein